MRILLKPTKIPSLALVLFLSGCWMGGNGRTNYRPVSPTPSNSPVLNSPQYGPSGPVPESLSTPPAQDGPAIEGPAFPHSSRFNRRRHTERLPMPAEDTQSDYAGTSPPAFVPDGPIARRPQKTARRPLGYDELPPSP